MFIERLRKVATALADCSTPQGIHITKLHHKTAGSTQQLGGASLPKRCTAEFKDPHDETWLYTAKLRDATVHPGWAARATYANDTKPYTRAECQWLVWHP